MRIMSVYIPTLNPILQMPSRMQTAGANQKGVDGTNTVVLHTHTRAWHHPYRQSRPSSVKVSALLRRKAVAEDHIDAAARLVT